MGGVEVAQEAALAAEGGDAREELLQALEVRDAFDGDERFAVLTAGIAPALGDRGGVPGSVGCRKQVKAGVLDQAFVVSGRREDVVADGTAGRDLLG